jgi:hypothetical protein
MRTRSSEDAKQRLFGRRCVGTRTLEEEYIEAENELDEWSDMSNEFVDLTTDNAGARNWAAGARRFWKDEEHWGPTDGWSSLQLEAYQEQFHFLETAVVPEHRSGPWRRALSVCQRPAFDRFMTICRREQELEWEVFERDQLMRQNGEIR